MQVLTATGSTSTTAKAKFKAAWAAIRADLSEEDIVSAREYAENSAEALARYDRNQK
jgi:head-tail adaptor